MHPGKHLLECYAHQDMVLLLSANGTLSPIFTNWLKGRERILFVPIILMPRTGPGMKVCEPSSLERDNAFEDEIK